MTKHSYINDSQLQFGKQLTIQWNYYKNICISDEKLMYIWKRTKTELVNMISDPLQNEVTVS